MRNMPPPSPSSVLKDHPPQRSKDIIFSWQLMDRMPLWVHPFLKLSLCVPWVPFSLLLNHNDLISNISCNSDRRWWKNGILLASRASARLEYPPVENRKPRSRRTRAWVPPHLSATLPIWQAHLSRDQRCHPPTLALEQNFQGLLASCSLFSATLYTLHSTAASNDYSPPQHWN
jgi:hypothetical protein